MPCVSLVSSLGGYSKFMYTTVATGANYQLQYRSLGHVPTLQEAYILDSFTRHISRVFLFVPSTTNSLQGTRYLCSTL